MAIFGRQSAATTPAVPATASERLTAERHGAINTLANLDARRGAEFRQLHANAEAAVACVLDAERRLLAARDHVSVTDAARLSASISNERTRGQFEAWLTETSSPAIALFVREMSDEIDRTNRLVSGYSAADRDVVTGRRVKTTHTNVASIEARTAACRAAIAAAQELRLTEPDHAAVPAALAALRAALPAVSAT